MIRPCEMLFLFVRFQFASLHYLKFFAVIFSHSSAMIVAQRQLHDDVQARSLHFCSFYADHVHSRKHKATGWCLSVLCFSKLMWHQPGHLITLQSFCPRAVLLVRLSWASLIIHSINRPARKNNCMADILQVQVSTLLAAAFNWLSPYRPKAQGRQANAPPTLLQGCGTLCLLLALA